MITTQKTNYLTIEHFIDIVTTFQELKSKLPYLEDIPPFETRYDGVLESIIEQIKGECFGVELYPDTNSKAAWLFYSIIKNHPFQNGNKRIAVTALTMFLNSNSLNVESKVRDERVGDKLYDLAVFVAGSKSEDKDIIYEDIKSSVKQLSCFLTDKSNKNKWFWIF